MHDRHFRKPTVRERELLAACLTAVESGLSIATRARDLIDLFSRCIAAGYLPGPESLATFKAGVEGYISSMEAVLPKLHEQLDR